MLYIIETLSESLKSNQSIQDVFITGQMTSFIVLSRQLFLITDRRGKAKGRGQKSL